MNTIFMIEFLGFDIAAVIWAGYELWTVRGNHMDLKAEDKAEPLSAEPPRHPEG
jgi:hypothetical protein